MRATPDAQRRLLDLQAADTAIAQLNHRRRSIPELATIAAAQTERSALGAQITKMRTSISDLELEQTRSENDLTPVRERKARNEVRVGDGSITDPKQLRAMLDEIAHLERRISELEDAQLDLMERLETSQGELAELNGRRTAGEVELRALMASRDEQTRAIDADLATQAATRAEVAATIPADLLAAYAKTAERQGGTGAALLQNGRCTGCQLTLTQADLNRVRAAEPDEVLRCEECNRILVR